MANPTLKLTIFTSLALHLGLVGFAFYRYSSFEKPQWQPKEGSTLSVHFPKARKGTDSSPATPSYASGAQEEKKAVEKFLENLRYPPSAKERGLESDCEWLVTVAENGKAEKVEDIRQCKFKIFDSYFRNAVKDWDFPLPTGTRIRIPVRFSLKSYEKK